jgi:outer membrane immunogenic protein
LDADSHPDGALLRACRYRPSDGCAAHMDFGSIDASVSASGVPLSVAIGDFRTTISQNLTSAFHTRVTDDVLRIGVNYRFGGPVVAKY